MKVWAYRGPGGRAVYAGFKLGGFWRSYRVSLARLRVQRCRLESPVGGPT